MTMVQRFDNPTSEPDGPARLLAMKHETELLDFGDWGNGPEDAYTAPEHMQLIWAAGNVGGGSMQTFRISVRIPPSWGLREVERRLEQMGFQDVVVSRGASAWTGL